MLEYRGSEGDFTNLAEIRIGWFGPHDATNSSTADEWWAANLAVREGNAQGGCANLPVRLVPRWAADSWRAGGALLTRMVYDEQPLALLGSVDSPSTHLAEQVVAKANLPLVSPVATDKSVTLAGVSWMFSCAPADDAIARVLVADVLAMLPGVTDELALVACTDHESRMTAREVLRELSRCHRLPGFRFDIPANALEITRQMVALGESRPAAVLVVASAEDTARLVAAVREKAPAARIFGSQSMGRFRFRDLAGPAAEGVRFPLLFVPDRRNQATARFIDRFTAECGRAPDYTAALAYDATRFLIEAIRRAGPNRARIRENLKELSPWAGIAGTICFDGTGQNTRTNLTIGTILHGEIIPCSLTRTGEQQLNHSTKP